MVAMRRCHVKRRVANALPTQGQSGAIDYANANHAAAAPPPICGGSEIRGGAALQ